MNKARAGRKTPRRAAKASGTSTPANVWRHLVEGRLPVRRFYDKGGRRFIVVAPAKQESPLTLRQRQIIAFRVYGETTKHVARELGVSEPTVIREIGSALKKLGLTSEVELPVLFGTALRSERRA